MASGGIRDHIGGGFARYSVDAKWLVPHFEKMLYDNALLAEVYVRAYQVTGNQRHADVAGETLNYLCRDMFDESGGIHCSEDADSEGVEGKVYVWTPDEVVAVLGERRGTRFCQIYDITPMGNFEGKNIPNLPRAITDWAEELSVNAEQLAVQLTEDCEQLRLVREERIKPGRDDKVLTAWNALAIRALAIGGAVLEESRYVEAAERAGEFIASTMTRDDGRLLHAFRGGHAHLDGYVDDYAYTIDSFVGLFEATGQTHWIGRAVKLAELMIEYFVDTTSGGFFYTASDAAQLISRNKEWHDGSLVSGNASAVLGLLKLSRLCDRNDFREVAERTLLAATDVLEKQSAACGAMLSALDRYLHDQVQLVLAVDRMDDVGRLRGKFLRQYRPRATMSWVVGDADGGDVVALNQQKAVMDGEPALYRCENFTCDQPIQGDQAIDWLLA